MKTIESAPTLLQERNGRRRHLEKAKTLTSTSWRASHRDRATERLEPIDRAEVVLRAGRCGRIRPRSPAPGVRTGPRRRRRWARAACARPPLRPRPRSPFTRPVVVPRGLRTLRVGRLDRAVASETGRSAAHDADVIFERHLERRPPVADRAPRRSTARVGAGLTGLAQAWPGPPGRGSDPRGMARTTRRGRGPIGHLLLAVGGTRVDAHLGELRVSTIVVPGRRAHSAKSCPRHGRSRP
jgi:hypothetical protein